MDIPLRMPDLATTGAGIKVLRWLVQPGQMVRRGEPLLEVETDKAVMQVEAVATGLLKTLIAAEGDEIDAGQTIAILEGSAPPASADPARPRELAAAPASLRQPDPAPAPRPDGPRRSFFARNREARNRRAMGGPATAFPPRTIPLSVPQKVVARRMAESKRTIPHFYLQTSADAGPMLARREASSVVWDAFFVHAAGKALRAFERMACRFEDDRLIVSPCPAVGVAVDVGDELFTLAVEHPAEKTLEAVSAEIAAGVERLRGGDPQARIARPACLTVSNLGGSGIEAFAAVINPPESAILAVGRVMPTAVVVDGGVVVQHRVQLTLSVDHRVASGRYAAGFLNAIVRALELRDQPERTVS
jgi:pyruvate dehydrogenase E2 component (dihydrolipoamide acetyltransferase)